MNKEVFLIEKDVLVGLLNYLAKRPYEEVAQAVNVLQQLKPADPQGLEKEDKKN